MKTSLARELRAALRCARAARTHINRAYLASDTDSPIEDRAANMRHDICALESALRNTLKLLRDADDLAGNSAVPR